MGISDWAEELPKRQEKLRQRALEVRKRVQEGSTYAFEHLLQERMDTYFIFEERLEEFDRLFSQIHDEVGYTTEMPDFQRLEGRFNYLEDTFEEVDSQMRGRPARRRSRKFSFFHFFRQWQEEQAGTVKAETEFKDTTEAYQLLDLPSGADLKTVTSTFRRLVKNLHPDTRNGDRSSEPQLRKLMAAYRFIKKALKR